MRLTAREAGLRVGRTRQAIIKAIRKGTISAEKDDAGEWRIDPAELFRVYPPASPVDDNQPTTESARDTGGLQREIDLLREQVTDLRTERDRLLTIVETQAQQVKQLTDQRQRPRKGWWRFGR